MKMKAYLLILLVLSTIGVVACDTGTETMWISSGDYVYKEYKPAREEDSYNIKILKKVKIKIDIDAGKFILKQPDKDDVSRDLAGSYWITSCQPNNTAIEHLTVLGGPLKLTDSITIESPLINAINSSCHGGNADGLTLFDQHTRTLKFKDGSIMSSNYVIDFKLKK